MKGGKRGDIASLGLGDERKGMGIQDAGGGGNERYCSRGGLFVCLFLLSPLNAAKATRRATYMRFHPHPIFKSIIGCSAM